MTNRIRWLSVCALLLLSTVCAASERFVAVSNDEVVGTLEVTRNENRIGIDYRIDDNGRGPKIRESIRVDSAGMPVEWRIEGAGNIGAPVREEFRVHGGWARWHSLNDSGEAPSDDQHIYIASAASPWSQGLYLQQLLRRPDRSLAMLPAGSLRAESVREFNVGSGERRRSVTVYALHGLKTAPQFVLALADGSFFGTISAGFVLVPDGFQGEFRTLSQLASDLGWQMLEGLSKQMLHQYDRPVYIRNVRVFDSIAGTLGGPASVVVFRDRIVGVRGNKPPPSDTIVVDGQGGTLVPGLTDMHSHVSAWDMPLYLAGGVTSVRDLGNDNEVLQDLLTRVLSGSIMGPRMTLSGFIEGRSKFSARLGFVVDQLPAALAKVRWYADHGYRGIKLYSSITPDWVRPIAEEAHHLGLHVSGHVPAFMTSERAVRDGYDEINHMNQLLLSFVLAPNEDTRTPLRFTAVGERFGQLDLHSEPVQRMVALMKERGTTLDVTMAGLEWMLLSEPGKSPPAIEDWLSHMPGPVQRARRTAVLDMKPGQLPLYRASWRKLQSALKMLDEAGIRIVPGTDDEPGFMLHSELEVYARAGIPNARVLQIATIGCARFLGREQELGSIETGKLADFILVAGDPTKDMSVIRQIRMVVTRGSVVFPEEVHSAMGVRPFASKLPVLVSH